MGFDSTRSGPSSLGVPLSRIHRKKWNTETCCISREDPSGTDAAVNLVKVLS